MKRFALVALVIGCTVSCDCGSSGPKTRDSIKCFSGGTVIFESDNVEMGARYRDDTAWSFKDGSTGRWTKITGDCIVKE